MQITVLFGVGIFVLFGVGIFGFAYNVLPFIYCNRYGSDFELPEH